MKRQAVPRLKLVCYHYLQRDDVFHRIWGHSFELFKAHIEKLIDTYHPITLTELDAYLAGKTDSLPSKCSLISFDDALREHASIVAPYLNSLEIKGIFNIPTDIMRGIPIAPQINHFMMAYYGVREYYRILHEFIPSAEKGGLKERLTIEGHEKMEIMQLHTHLKRILKYSENDPELALLLQTVWQEVMMRDQPGAFEAAYLARDDVKELRRNGHEIGCHSKSHALINDETWSEDLYNTEVIEAKQELEKVIEGRVQVFTYPYGTEKDIITKKEHLSRFGHGGFSYLMPSCVYKDSWDTHFLGRYCSHSKDTPDELLANAWEYEVVRS